MSTLGKLQDELDDAIHEFMEWSEGKTQDTIEAEMKRRLRKFWGKQPWYIQLLKPFVMKSAYRTWKGVIK